MCVESIGFDLITDLCGVTLHPRLAAVSALAVVLGHVSLLPAQSAGPSVHGAAPGVGAALQPRGAQDACWEHTTSEVKFDQLGLEAHSACLDTLCLHVQPGWVTPRQQSRSGER